MKTRLPTITAIVAAPMTRRFQFSLWTLLMTAGFAGVSIALFKADPLDNRTRAAIVSGCLMIGAVDLVRYLRRK
ncbi:MAG TPA: hypothetical protein VJ783_06020 [Pirellulales bacterium]|nr:hypothetical protein [Pirellulales bacterium]